MKEYTESFTNESSVIIIGAGPAGLGIAIVLKKLGIDYIILEKDTIGSSFRKWPKESQLISPSFTGNFFKMPDLNAISPETSPAFSLLTEHPTGEEFADYLEIVADEYDLIVESKIDVKTVSKRDDFFIVSTTNGTYKCAYVIWAAGEYQYPKKRPFEGGELCTHFSEITSFSDLEGDEKIVIGGYESGFDASINLIEAGKAVTLLDAHDYLDLINSDSSYSLSPYTRDRIDSIIDDLSYHKETRVKKVSYDDDTYFVITENQQEFKSKTKPINCTGFDTSITLVKELFEHNDNYPLLNDVDESTKTNNLFLVGPQVKHGNALFCFIYKYRQRFAIVAQEIAERQKVSETLIKEVVYEYERQNFYLKDLSCCDDECIC